MGDEVRRHRVGDRDLEGEKRLKDSIKNAPGSNPAVKPAPAPAPSSTARTRVPAHEGVPIDDIVTGAERGPDLDKMHNNQYSDK